MDYVRFTKKCIHLIDTFRDMWNIEIKSKDMSIPLFESAKVGNNSNDLGRLYVCHQAFVEAKTIRENGIYTYRAGDGGDRAVKGFNQEDPDDEWRHGAGLLTTSKVFKHFLAKGDTDFRFPYKISDLALLEAEAEEAKSNKMLGSASIRQIQTAAELKEAFAGSTYIIADFYKDYSPTSAAERHCFADLGRKSTVPSSLLSLLRANTDDMRDFADGYGLGETKRGYVIFKEGKQVAVNGKKVTRGEKALKEAVEKLTALANKRLAEQEKMKA